ncbi:MAG: hypothetical protein R8N23_13695 [Reichenbachiella sp.]|uniref:hypothetical protein n=1 Tax=Reichenbachiella sp. TaxID=2184521 RepID=UPI002965E390|nr:hypothetical protein [Reichenbachiella sp.]MDW3210923.1 hypothetical protein [Reichenbachiella sp.]
MILLVVGFVLWWKTVPSITENLIAYNETLDLPPNLQIGYWDADVSFPPIGVVVEGKNGGKVVGKKSQFLINDDSIEVKRVIRFGFDSVRIVTEVEATDNGIYYVECMTNEDPRTRLRLKVTVWNDSSVIEPESLQWVDANEVPRY